MNKNPGNAYYCAFLSIKTEICFCIDRKLERSDPFLKPSAILASTCPNCEAVLTLQSPEGLPREIEMLEAIVAESIVWGWMIPFSSDILLKDISLHRIPFKHYVLPPDSLKTIDLHSITTLF